MNGWTNYETYYVYMKLNGRGPADFGFPAGTLRGDTESVNVLARNLKLFMGLDLVIEEVTDDATYFRMLEFINMVNWKELAAHMIYATEGYTA